jgi:DNA replication factor GINS
LDEFFQKLREIQKKERTNSGLARVGDDFYHRVHRYLEELRDTVGNDPFAKEQYLLRDTQRIATEICERREHKITDSAVMNIQRSYHLFKGKPQFDLQDTTPLNLTPEEEQLYFSLIDILKGYRDKIIPSLDALDEVLPNGLLKSNGSPKESGKHDSNDSFQQKKPADESIIKEYLADTASVNKKIAGESKKISDEVPTGDLSGSDVKQVDSSGDQTGRPSKTGTVSKNRFNTSENYQTPPNALKSQESSKNKTATVNAKLNFNTLVIFDEIPSIVGVDEKVYGPFCPQDVVILPEANSQIFIKARKGRLIRY